MLLFFAPFILGIQDSTNIHVVVDGRPIAQQYTVDENDTLQITSEEINILAAFRSTVPLSVFVSVSDHADMKGAKVYDFDDQLFLYFPDKYISAQIKFLKAGVFNFTAVTISDMSCRGRVWFSNTNQGQFHLSDVGKGEFKMNDRDYCMIFASGDNARYEITYNLNSKSKISYFIPNYEDNTITEMPILPENMTAYGPTYFKAHIAGKGKDRFLDIFDITEDMDMPRIPISGYIDYDEGVPKWLIILLSVLGAILLFVLIIVIYYFCTHRRRLTGKGPEYNNLTDPGRRSVPETP